MRAEHINALFVENITDPRMVETISRETGAPMGGALFSDALSPADGPAPTYVAMFKNNVAKLVAGMQQN
jgi:zinc/manganese transport system substrate-binding protein